MINNIKNIIYQKKLLPNIMVTEIIKTRTAKIWQDEQGIVHTVVNNDAELTLDDAIENIEAIKNITQKLPVAVLSDIRNISSVSKEHRNYFSSPNATEVIFAGAMLIKSPLSKVLGNVFLKINKPPYKGQLFTSESEALEWLRNLHFKL